MKIIINIFIKEFLETIRDRATIVLLLLPIMIFPMLSFGMSFFESSEKDIYNIALIDKNQNNTILAQFLTYNSDSIKIYDTDDPYSELSNNEIDCIIKTSKNMIVFVYNSKSFHSLSAATKIGEQVEHFILSSKFNRNYLTCVLADENGATNNSTNAVSVLIMPSVLIFLIFQSNSAISNDIFAGEKERKTMEMLLLSISKKEYIFFGKLFFVLLFSLTNTTICIISFVISAKDLKFVFSITNSVVLSLCFLCMVLISSIISSTISLHAKSIKNAQIVNEFMSVIPAVSIAMLLFGIIPAKEWWYTFIPIYNIIVCFYKVVLGQVELLQIVVSVIITLCLCSIIILYNCRYIKSEKVIYNI